MTTKRFLAVIVLSVAAVAGCSDDSTDDAASTTAERDDATTISVPAGEVCGHLQAVRDYNDESQALAEAAAPTILAATTQEERNTAFLGYMDQYVSFLDATLPEMIANYDALAALVPAELAPDVVTMRDFIVFVADGLADASTVAEAEAVFSGEVERARAVADASLRVNEFSRETCDITIGSPAQQAG